MPLILASASPIRRHMLEAAGVEHEAVPSDVDEAALKRGLEGAEATALELAKAKALDVSRGRPGAWVIGSDSLLALGTRLFDKPRGRAEAAAHLSAFSGRSVALTSAVALAHGGIVDWSHVETASLGVRPLSAAFIERYLEREWPDVAYCVGVFRLEGAGVQLFESIEGDHFTILGMPLLPLLGALRNRGVLAS